MYKLEYDFQTRPTCASHHMAALDNLLYMEGKQNEAGEKCGTDFFFKKYRWKYGKEGEGKHYSYLMWMPEMLIRIQQILAQRK